MLSDWKDRFRFPAFGAGRHSKVVSSAALAAVGLAVVCIASSVSAEEAAAPPTAEQLKELLATPKVVADTMWTLITAMLVFFMNLGFAMVESGLCRAKNCVNILAKNFIVFARLVARLLHPRLGPDVRRRERASSAPRGSSSSAAPTTARRPATPTAASTARSTGRACRSGRSSSSSSCSPAPRRRSSRARWPSASSSSRSSSSRSSSSASSTRSPGTGSGAAAGSRALGFWDFAGSTVVHSVGGWAALAGVIVLGPRIGKYSKDGKVTPIPGHNMTSATIGVFVLWFGWFGFNPGSTMAADPLAIAHIAVTTNTAAAAASLQRCSSRRLARSASRTCR